MIAHTGQETLVGPFPFDVPPARPGVYRAETRSGVFVYQYWSGSKWGAPMLTADDAYAWRGVAAGLQCTRWWGLGEKQ